MLAWHPGGFRTDIPSTDWCAKVYKLFPSYIFLSIWALVFMLKQINHNLSKSSSIILTLPTILIFPTNQYLSFLIHRLILYTSYKFVSNNAEWPVWEHMQTRFIPIYKGQYFEVCNIKDIPRICGNSMHWALYLCLYLITISMYYWGPNNSRGTLLYHPQNLHNSFYVLYLNLLVQKIWLCLTIFRLNINQW